MERCYEAAGGAVPRDCGGGAVPCDPASAGSTAGISADTPQDAAERSRRLAAFKAQHRSALSSLLVALRGLHVRPEVDSDRIGSYMRDAMERGGYRAALAHYRSDEARKACPPLWWFRDTGWLLGRLGLYDQVEGWLAEAAGDPFLELPTAPERAGKSADYRTPPLWLQVPRPVPLSSDGIMTLERVAPVVHDIRVVPDYIWTVMLILETAGPICSHAILGAAAFLVEAEAGRPARGLARGDLRYDPLRGARLHGAPEGCHRWIIADIDFDPNIDGPHYYYDLTDEGREALDAARAAGVQWPKSVEAAASGLKGMALPDLLEGACMFARPAHGLEKMRDDLADVARAWQDQDDGNPVSYTCKENRALVDLGEIARWPDSDGSPGSALDHLDFLQSAIESAHAIAGEAEPSSRSEDAVLRALIGALLDLCRRHAKVAAAAPLMAPRVAPGDCDLEDMLKEKPRPPMYSDVTPAMICDLSYCLGEYSESRGLAVDPCNVHPLDVFTDEEKAATAKAFARSGTPYSMQVDRGVTDDTGVITQQLGSVDTSWFDY